jgi:hypothetical protein
MRWGNNLELVERTNHRAVVIEPAHYPAGFFFLVIGASNVVAMLSGNPARLEPIVLVIAAWVVGLGLYCCVNSTFMADHTEASLRVRRAIWGVAWERRYPFNEIEAVTIRKTWTHGNGLALRLISGKSKSLTLSLHFQLLEPEQAALTHAIGTGHAKVSRTVEHGGLRG